jgi:hypothetical protein
MKSTRKKTENKYIPTSLPISRMIRWWRNQSSENDKGGTFNVEHYLKVSEVLNQGTLHRLCRHSDTI